MAEEFIFIWHDYFGENVKAKSKYRAIVKAAFEEVNSKYLLPYGRNFTPVFGDTKQSECPALFQVLSQQDLFQPNQGYWIEIIGKISLSTFAIFDLTHNSLRSHLNANVILEYGVALGLNKSCHVLTAQLRLVKRHLSNIAGTLVYPYNNTAALRNAIIEICQLHATMLRKV
ncbi:nucleotide-binding protein [candidate division KSB1 bacterium]|nr:nucleotide-binding protein [candidate division KSB1 bacterium]